MKLQGMNEIEKTSEHIDIIRLLTLKKLLDNVAIGINATWHMELPMKAIKCETKIAHL
jgi:hypothetical protein